MIRRILDATNWFDLDLAEREIDDSVDFTSPDYGPNDPR